MKYFIALLLAFGAFFGSNQLTASEFGAFFGSSPLASEFGKYLMYSWSGDEEYLYLDINLSNELEFPDTYTTMRTKNGRGLECEIVCKPMPGSIVVSSKGNEIKEIKLTVVLNNTYDHSKVDCKIIEKFSYERVNDKGHLLSSITEFKTECMLYNPSIDLTQNPVFSITDGLNEGTISFKNSFPYSQLQ